jgi:hypothetical protein
VKGHYNALKQCFAWCEEEGEVQSSPMARMRPPALDEPLTPVVSKADLERLGKGLPWFRLGPEERFRQSERLFRPSEKKLVLQKEMQKIDQT